MSDMFALITEQINETQRAQIHAFVKEHADSWWHEFLDVWIVEGGDSAGWWRRQLWVIFHSGPASLLVIRLPTEEADRNWSSFMPNGSQRTKWLVEKYRTYPAEKAIEEK